jgi:hypothetical protein
VLTEGSFAATCNASLNSQDATALTCVATPSNTMACNFPEGSVTCPALYISPGDALDSDGSYIQGCCSDQRASGHASPFCGIPATIGCEPVDPGNQYYVPAP